MTYRGIGKKPKTFRSDGERISGFIFCVRGTCCFTQLKSKAFRHALFPINRCILDGRVSSTSLRS